MTLSRRTQVTLWCLLAGLATLVGLGWFLTNYERVSHSVDMPRTGEARFNPLYALKLALEKDDVPVKARRRLQLYPGSKNEPAVPLAVRDTVVIYSDPRTLSRREVDGLLDWVARGGHLVVRTPVSDVLMGERGGVVLFDALELRSMDEDSGDCMSFHLAPGVRDEPPPPKTGTGRRRAAAAIEEGELAGYLLCGPRFNLDGANPEYSWGDLGAGYVYARLAYGEGSVDVLADQWFLSSDGLEHEESRVFARQVLAPNFRAGTIHLVYASELPSLWGTLFRHSWMAWAPLLLAFLAWLWLRVQRFGPQLPAPDDARRSLLEHIVASGGHAYRYGYAHLLYDAVREAFLARLRRRDPQAAALVGEPQLALLQARFPDVAAAQIRDALTAPFANDHASFRTRIATLIRLRNRL